MSELSIWIIFVCLGNTCRSPVAMALAKEMWKDEVKVSSAGVDASDGKPATDAGWESIGCLEIADDAKERVVTHLRKSHTSRTIETALERDNDTPDVVVALTEEIAMDLTKEHGIPRTKIVVLGVEDPWLKDLPSDPLRYQDATTQIYDALRAKKTEIFEAAKRPYAEPPSH